MVTFFAAIIDLIRPLGTAVQSILSLFSKVCHIYNSGCYYFFFNFRVHVLLRSTKSPIPPPLPFLRITGVYVVV